MSRIKIIAIVGRGGSGKSYLFDKFKDYLKFEAPKIREEIHFLIPYTTRPPRVNEKDGVDYHFVSGVLMTTRKDSFIDYQEFDVGEDVKWQYGISTQSLRDDRINIGIFSGKGVQELIDSGEYDVYPMYVVASQDTRLKRQLRRGNKKEALRRIIADDEDPAYTDININTIARVYNSFPEWSYAGKTFGDETNAHIAFKSMVMGMVNVLLNDKRRENKTDGH